MSFTYTVIKSDRKTYSIRISDDNEITVRAPLRATQKQIEEVVQKKSAWIERVISLNNANSLDKEEVRSMQCAYVNGNLMPVTVGTRNFIDEDGVHITSYGNFKAAYVSGLGRQFLSRFFSMSDACNLKCSSVGFRSYKSRWGCCDSENKIVFNFKLLMLPEALQDYVIIHELCHTVYHNHSREFWNLVKSFMPDFMQRRKQLKNYNFIVKMY